MTNKTAAPSISNPAMTDFAPAPLCRHCRREVDVTETVFLTFRSKGRTEVTCVDCRTRRIQGARPTAESR